VRKNKLDILLVHFDTVACRRVRAEQLRDAARFGAFLGLKLFEEAHGCRRIVSRLVHILQAEVTRSRLIFTGELEELHGDEQSGRRADREPANAAHEDERYRREIYEFAL